MKKVVLILMALMFLLTGCGKTVDTSTKPNSTKSKGYEFETKGVKIAMHAKAAPILKSLGEAKDYFESKSCAFEGMEKTYTYNGFELHTYEIKGIDYVASVVFLDDSISTKEGVALYSNLDKVIAAYGDKYTKELSLYTYKLDKSKISFLIENDKITSIEYTAVPDK